MCDVDGRSVVQGHENVTVHKLAICYLHRNGDEGVWGLPLCNIVRSIRCGVAANKVCTCQPDGIYPKGI